MIMIHVSMNPPHGQRHIFEDGLVVAGRGWNASIKLGSMLGRSTGCYGLPLTASPHRQDTETSYLSSSITILTLIPTSLHPPTPLLLSQILFQDHTRTLFRLRLRVATANENDARGFTLLLRSIFFLPKADLGINWPRIILILHFRRS